MTYVSAKPWKDLLKPLLLVSSIVTTGPSFAADDGADAATFRNIFYSYAKSQYSTSDIQKLIFQPKADFFKTGPVAGDVDAVLKERAKAFSRFSPKELYDDGVATPANEVDALDLDDALANHPITLVVIPGIFGEFILHYPFHEVLEKKDSAFAKEWATAAVEHRAEDPVFDLETLAETPRDMKEIIEAASIDNAEGKAVVRVIYLKPLLGSLETLGTLEDSSKLYLRRLNKLWAMLGPQENIYLIGYSRGLNVALDVMNRAEASPGDYPWREKVKGIVSLGGTLYGSDIADAARKPGEVTYAAIERMVSLANDLKVLPDDASLADKLGAVVANSGAWAMAGVDLLKIGSKIPQYDGLKIEKISSDAPDFGAFAQLFMTFAFDKFKVTSGSEYSNNIVKFQHLIKKTLEGIETLTKASSLAWIKDHTLPTRLKYFVIQGTMGEPSDEASGPSELATDSVSFNTKTLDYKALRRSYYDYLAFEGMSLNDSQVSPDRSIFWPELHMALNPKQGPFESRLITVLGTDHWGMSFPVALESRNEEISPFPREVLVRSLGAFLAQDLNKVSQGGN